MAYPSTLTYPGTNTYPGLPSYATGGFAAIAQLPVAVDDVPRVLLSGSGFGGTFSVWRYDQSGAGTPVRSMNPATALGDGSILGYDYEAPFGVPVTYAVVQAIAGGTTALAVSAPVVLNVQESWLIHAGIPTISCRITVVALDDEVMADSGAMLSIIGRSTGIYVGSGNRKAATSTLTVKALTADDNQNLQTILLDNSTVLLQMADATTSVTEYRWIQPFAVTKGARQSRTLGDQRRIWSIPFADQASPVGSVQAQRTWADYEALGLTWAQTAATYPTWRDFEIATS